MLRRAFHVYHNGSVRASLDTFGQAYEVALRIYESAADGSQTEIYSAGVVVWGPYVKGSTRYQPATEEK